MDPHEGNRERRARGGTIRETRVIETRRLSQTYKYRYRNDETKVLYTGFETYEYNTKRADGAIERERAAPFLPRRSRHLRDGAEELELDPVVRSVDEPRIGERAEIAHAAPLSKHRFSMLEALDGVPPVVRAHA